MNKKRKLRLDELIQENKAALLEDPKELEKIERRLDKKHMDRLMS
ncbi:Fur-regulated basic protein B [Evansella caseinilytica]|uniref:Fur-regulated basic protein B n=1 Tax=Evansella caseinilytica TaxID=1503961 RepID=A0A1H3V2C8_9BACI|nr:FbpB family small basic protein [Evansella caseinilytica]SDZ68185.1 Fur-regulated basic protein B [Evansella caseinilytica]